MEDRVENLLSYCSKIGFGEVNLASEQNKFYKEWNNEIILFCRSLPESTQTDASLFFMGNSGTSIGDDLNLFRSFYVPAWSVIYWLIQSGPDDKRLEQKDIQNARTGHLMAVFLHYLDDHLKDNELPVTHLALLLRSQSWMIMNNAFNSLADGVDGGEQIVQDFIDDYYFSIRSSEEIESLDDYCDLFRKQMATGLIVPVLLMKKKFPNDEVFAHAIQNAGGSFGIAWRLLDDIKDIEIDIWKGVHSSIYICLPEGMKYYWDELTKEVSYKESDVYKIIIGYLMKNSVIDMIKERICSELESAIYYTASYNMTGLADEFRCMLKPIENR